ncbi:hypothetical protein ACFLUF_00420 [Chloroflexota bacterium]
MIEYSTLVESWIFLGVWFIIGIIMAGFFRRIWGFFGVAALALFIESSRTCQDISIWLIIAGVICLILAIPLFIKDFKESKQQSLKDDIFFIQQTQHFQSSVPVEEELERLLDMNLFQWIGSWFKR